MITRNTKRHVHPFRHLLILYFLEQDVDDFVNQKVNGGPFGMGPWPCLNKVAAHYRESVIPNVKVTRDFKSTASIGIFSCSCGFVYTRKGPDMSLEDRFRKKYLVKCGIQNLNNCLRKDLVQEQLREN